MNYDVGNRLRSVSMAGQNRTFSYDPRGFLTAECHPEKGASGNGCVAYQNYDALGNPGRQVDGPFDLRYAYDPAGRLTALDEWTGGALRPVERFTYATANLGTDRRQGKLQTAERYNHVTLNGDPFTVQVRETYEHTGTGGVPSRRETAFFVNGKLAESFTQGFTWTDLGDPATPACPESTRAACTNPYPKTQSFAYQHGFRRPGCLFR